MAGKLTLVLALFILFPDGNVHESQKISLIYFSGSDWCPECIRFERKVLSDTTFTSFLNRHSITLEQADFPQRKKLSKQEVAKNERLAERYSFDGTFPTLLLGRTDTLLYVELNYVNQPTGQLIQQINSKLNQLQ